VHGRPNVTSYITTCNASSHGWSSFKVVQPPSNATLSRCGKKKKTKTKKKNIRQHIHTVVSMRTRISARSTVVQPGPDFTAGSLANGQHAHFSKQKVWGVSDDSIQSS